LNPDVVAAVARLRADNVLSGQPAAFFDRVARRLLVSVRFEIRTLLYIGVLLLTSGVGLLVKEHHREIGPLAIALAIGLAAAACLVWVGGKAGPFSWEEVPSPDVAFDYILLLGLLLFASDLAYLEVQFTLLGPNWAHHLLIVGAVYLAAAYWWDSRTVLGLALATLAAWRGLSVSLVSGWLWKSQPNDLRENALVLGVVYLAAAALSVLLRRKPHFEAVFANAGLVLLLGALVSGALDNDTAWEMWLTVLLVTAGVVMWHGFRLDRSLYFAQGVVAGYIGLLRLLFQPFRHTESGIPYLLAALLGVGMLFVIFAAHCRMQER
jgi:hypothetical protein